MEDLGGSYFGERWSYNLARPPGWLVGASDAVVRWYHDNVFDRRDIDPNASLASIEDTFRRDAARLGVRAPADSAGCLLAYGQLQVGETNWAEIAGGSGSAAPSGAGALAAPLLDVIAAQEAAAVSAYRATPGVPLSSAGTPEGTDATILANLRLTGGDIATTLAGGAPIFQPVAASPMPDPDARSILATTQTGYVGTGGFMTNSMFGNGVSAGVVATGVAPDYAAQSAHAGKGLIIIALAVGAFFVLRKYL